MSVKLISAALLLAASAVISSAAWATGDAVAGKSKAFTCMGCHGVPNYSNAYPTYYVPRLGGQQALYLVSALKGYRSGDRSHPTMRAQASNLSDQDMEDIAAYFSAAGQ